MSGSLVISTPLETAELIGGALLWLEAEEGVEHLDVERITERGPGQDGETDLGADVRARTITYAIGLGKDTIADLYEARRLFRRLFQPRTPTTITYTLPDGSVRQIDGFYTGRPAFIREGLWERASVQVRCSDPTFYNPSPINVNFAISAGGTAFTVPLPVPVFVGASTIEQSRVVPYTGEAATYPTIRIFGPAVDPIITNTTTGDLLDFTGASLATGETLTIDTQPGAKTVTLTDTSGVDTNAIAWLSDMSTLSTFRIAPDPEAPGGLNSLSASLSGATSATQADIIFYARYLGV